MPERTDNLLCCRKWFQYLDFIRYAWHAQMTNEFDGRPDVLLNGVPVLEFYDIKDSKWASLGYESLFFAGFFFFAWLVCCTHHSLQDSSTS